MRTDLTDLTLIVDRSGSMRNIREDAEGGVNTLIEEQQKEAGACTFTLVEFDDRYDVLADGIDINEAQPYILRPRGRTAYLDAVGQTINTIGERLAKTPESDRPGLVIVAIITDGIENASKEFTEKDILEMISHQREKYQWQFTFLGADESAIKQAESIGIQVDQAMPYSPDNIGSAYGAVSAAISRTRVNVKAGSKAGLKYNSDEKRKAVEGS